MSRESPPAPRRDAEDIQALVRTGFGKLDGACYLMLRIADAGPARLWLRAQTVASVGDLSRRILEHVIQVAFTAAGLRALGVADEVLSGFAPEYLEGMAGDPSRSRRLGDIGENEPSGWDWGVDGREPHVVLLLFAAADDIGAFAEKTCAAALAAGFSLVEMLPTAVLDDREPFGFADGLSQPTIDWDDRRTPNTSADMDFHNIVAPGEVLLGYRNEYNLFTGRPLLHASAAGAERLPDAADDAGQRDLGRNGSYLVFRQLDQDVREFWRWAQQAAGTDGAVGLAEAMVGRRMSGAPFSALGTREIPGVEDRALNGFTYSLDPDGIVCPIGNHIRRANPRTGDYPGGRAGVIAKIIAALGLSGTAEADVIASSRFHRLLRRGRRFGARFESVDALRPNSPDPKAGLYFICLNANIGRQFEFVQGAWLANAKFGNMTGEQDPLLGNRLPFPQGQATDRFTQPQPEGPCRVMSGLPQFVRVRGGGYFFLPGLRALGWLLGGR